MEIISAVYGTFSLLPPPPLERETEHLSGSEFDYRVLVGITVATGRV